MDAETVREFAVVEIEKAKNSRVAEVLGWVFEIDGLAVFISIRPRTAPEKEYLLRITFEDFPRRCPSFLFVNSGSKQPGNWPPNIQHGSGGICIPGTREFHEQIHQNDQQYPYDPDTYSLLETLHRIQLLVEGKTKGR